MLANGKKWWSRYNPTEYNSGLLNHISINQLNNRLIISAEDTKIKNIRRFAYFDSYVQFYQYQTSMLKLARCCYEKIIGRYAQKPHFDIDINLENFPFIDEDIFNDIINNIISCIDEELVNVGIELDYFKDIMIFTSSNDHKKSAHIVINNYTHSNHIEAVNFYKLVTSRMDPDYAQFIDSGVYASSQDFRIVGNHKSQSGRFKIFKPKWNYNGLDVEFQFPETYVDYNKMHLQDTYKRLYNNEYTMYQELHILKCSLVSWIEDCTILPRFEAPKLSSTTMNTVSGAILNRIAIKNTLNGIGPEMYDEQINLTKSQCMQAFDIVKEYFNNLKIDFPFYILSSKGSLIILRRRKKSYCPICERVHDAENPYLTANDNNIIYMCRRDSNKTKLKITNILQNKVKDENDTVELCIDNGNYSNLYHKPSNHNIPKNNIQEYNMALNISTKMSDKININIDINNDKNINNGENIKKTKKFDYNKFAEQQKEITKQSISVNLMLKFIHE